MAEDGRPWPRRQGLAKAAFFRFAFAALAFDPNRYRVRVPRLPKGRYSRGSKKLRKSSCRQSLTIAGDENTQSKGIADLGWQHGGHTDPRLGQG